MCGILGSVNIPLDQNILPLLHHRGPDSSGYLNYTCNNSQVFLGQTRLSIVDLSDAGSQPMLSHCGNYALIYNGEIYNHQSLREKLTENIFKGHSDTETMLHYLIKYGIGALKDFNGIFAFALLDKLKNKLLLVRDPFGVKPLYYYQKAGKLLFSSELKVIHKVIDSLSINHYNLYSFLRLRFNPSPQTLLNDVYKLEPGHYLEFDLETLQMGNPRFYSYIPERNAVIKENEALEEYNALLHQSVKRQLMSDVPISIMLSGGVDSALLTFLAQKIMGEQFTTFTVGYNDKSYADELYEAKRSAEILGTKHNEIIISQDDFGQTQGDFVKMVEEPVGSQSLFPFYHLSKHIHEKGFKVALSGQGIDEAWAGYKRYNFQNLFDDYAGQYGTFLNIFNLFLKNDKYRRAINSLREKDRILRYIASYSFFDEPMVKNLTSFSFTKDHKDYLYNTLKQKFDLYQLAPLSAVDSMMTLDTRTALSDDLLLYTDKLSMQHSLEVRVPFLDIDLMKFVESLPFRYKVNLTKNKILHKKLAERYLPEEIIYRRKKGFYIPRKEWFRGETGKTFQQLIEEDKSPFSKSFNTSYISSLFIKHRAGIYNYEDQLYSIMNLFFWFNLFCKE